MRGSFEQPLPPSLAANASKGYPLASVAAGPVEVSSGVAAGVLSVSGEAMARFIQMVLGRGELEGRRVLSPEGFARWVEPQVTVAGNALGRAIYEQRPYGVRGIGHAGDLSYFHSQLFVAPEHGFGVFVVQNSTGRSARLLRRFLVTALVRRYLAEPGGEPTTGVDTNHAREVAGV